MTHVRFENVRVMATASVTWPVEKPKSRFARLAEWLRRLFK